jgi:hypothetical protein
LTRLRPVAPPHPIDLAFGQAEAGPGTAILSLFAAERLTLKVWLLQSAIATLITSYQVEPQLACAPDE